MKSTEKKNFFLTYIPFKKSSNHSKHIFQMHSFKHSPNTYCISDLGHIILLRQDLVLTSAEEP